MFRVLTRRSCDGAINNALETLSERFDDGSAKIEAREVDEISDDEIIAPLSAE